MEMTHTSITLRDGEVALIDSEDYDKVSKLTWKFLEGYAASRDGNLTRMHRLVMNCNDPNLLVDHIDGNKLDNRKSNLRICTPSENRRNRVKKAPASSKYKGVRLLKSHGYYQVRITKDNKTITIGHYTNEVAAANAYNYSALEHHGEYSRLNDVPTMTEKEVESFKVQPRKRGKLQ